MFRYENKENLYMGLPNDLKYHKDKNLKFSGRKGMTELLPTWLNLRVVVTCSEGKRGVETVGKN